MKKKYLILLASAIAFLPISGVLAYGFGGFWGFNKLDPDQIAQRQQMMFEREAKILGISVEELKNYWAEGKSIREIMEEKGINQEDVQKRMREIRLQELKSYLDILVSKGVISQDQANKRYEIMKNWTENSRMGRGKGLFWGLGFGLPCGRK